MPRLGSLAGAQLPTQSGRQASGQIQMMPMGAGAAGAAAGGRPGSRTPSMNMTDLLAMMQGGAVGVGPSTTDVSSQQQQQQQQQQPQQQEIRGDSPSPPLLQVRIDPADGTRAPSQAPHVSGSDAAACAAGGADSVGNSTAATSPVPARALAPRRATMVKSATVGQLSHLAQSSFGQYDSPGIGVGEENLEEDSTAGMTGNAVTIVENDTTSASIGGGASNERAPPGLPGTNSRFIRRSRATRGFSGQMSGSLSTAGTSGGYQSGAQGRLPASGASGSLQGASGGQPGGVGQSPVPLALLQAIGPGLVQNASEVDLALLEEFGRRKQKNSSGPLYFA